jgi:hypothetical protein
MGGSAPAMAAQVADGYTLISAVALKRLTDPELDQLQFELERILRDLRSEIVDVTETMVVQARNRKLSRVNGSLQQIQATRAKRKRAW